MQTVVILLLLGIVVTVLVVAAQAHKKQEMINAFSCFSPIAGRTWNEIVSKAGPPQTRTDLGDAYLVQWQCPGFHIALLFNYDDVCEGVAHEHVDP